MSEIEVKKNKWTIISQLSLEIVAILFWVYSTIKVFVYDIDRFLIDTYLPNAAWIIEYKFFIILGLTAIILMFTKNRTILKWFLYIIFYPFILLFWKIPKLLIAKRSWVGAFALIGITLSFFKSLKFNVISCALFLIPIILILSFSQSTVLWISIALLMIFVSTIYFRSFYFAFRPSVLFQIQSQVISKFWERSKNNLELDGEIKNIPVAKMNKYQLEKWSNNLQLTVICNRICYFLASKLRDFQRSKINILYYVFNFVLIVVLTISVFGFINYALYKIDFNNFKISFIPNIFYFLYYSVSTFFTNSISDFYAVSAVARLIGTLEVVFGFLLIIILFSLLITVVSNRHTEELDAIVNAIDLQGKSFERFVESEFQMPINQAITELGRMKASLIKVIYYLSSNIGRGI